MKAKSKPAQQSRFRQFAITIILIVLAIAFTTATFIFAEDHFRWWGRLDGLFIGMAVFSLFELVRRRKD